MATRILESKFICYCRVVSDAVTSDYDPYSSIGIVKKLFKNNVTPDKREPSNTVSNDVILGSTIFKLDLLNVLLNNEVFPLKSIPGGADSSVETILYNAVNDFRFGDKVSFTVRLITQIDENGYISPMIKILYNRNNNIGETLIPLLEAL